ncbi:MAG: LamG domain-containing protein, partial [Planctomycetota bacterium]
GTQNRSVMAWVKTTGFGDWISWGQNTNTQKWIGRINDNAGNGAVGALRTECSGGYIISTTVVNDGEWHHLAAVLESAGSPTVEDIKMYVDGVQETISNVNPVGIDTVGGRNVWIADGHHNRPLPSLIDDVRLYNRALTPEEIVQAMKGIPPGVASNPSPDNEATDVPREVVLSWTPGEFAPPINGHKVYFSENFNDVNDGVGGIAQDASSYTRPQRLDFGTTYYWRVDEVNGPPDYTVYEGEVWSFTTEPISYAIENITATASSAHQVDMGPEKTIDGSGLDENDLHSAEATDMWLSSTEPLGAWIQYEFNKVYKLHQMWVWNSNQTVEPLLGFGLKDVTGTDYTTLGTTHEFARAPGMPGYAHNTTIDFGSAGAKYVRLTANSNWGGLMPQYGLSEVRFLHIPVNARKPYPDSGATDVSLGTIDEPVDVTLSWRAGREAVTHDVYFGADEQAVIDGSAGATTVPETSYGPLSLDLGKTYYWRVDEANEAETPTTWQGDLWDFTIQEYFVVDDFESYNDLDTTDPKSNRIFLTWIDGYGIATNGSLVGYENPPFCERTIVHSGKQSMPLDYSNSAGAAYSEAERTFAVGQNWTQAGATTLVLYFHGTDGNTGQLYVKVNGTKVVYGGDAGDIAKVEWKQWSIDLASLGAGLQNVTNLAIGIDGNGASGTLYVDDIRLYRLAPQPQTN